MYSEMPSNSFSEALRLGFSPGTPVSSPPSLVNGSANKLKKSSDKCDFISVKLNS